MDDNARHVLRRRGVLLAAGAAATLAVTGARATACSPLLNRTFARLQDEKPQPLCQYAGKVLLVVNTASRCGFTPQYEALETLYERYKGRGLVVLGFPSNDFGEQEPGTNSQIADFCENTFGVRFPMFAKTSVIGPQRNPLYADLARITGQSPGWNFHKYLVARDGASVTSFPSRVEPMDKAFLAQVEKLLGA